MRPGPTAIPWTVRADLAEGAKCKHVGRDLYRSPRSEASSLLPTNAFFPIATSAPLSFVVFESLPVFQSRCEDSPETTARCQDLAYELQQAALGTQREEQYDSGNYDDGGGDGDGSDGGP